METEKTDSQVAFQKPGLRQFTVCETQNKHVHNESIEYIVSIFCCILPVLGEVFNISIKGYSEAGFACAEI